MTLQVIGTRERGGTRAGNTSIRLARPRYRGDEPCINQWDLFHTPDGQAGGPPRGFRKALALCATCPSLEPCKQWAIAHEQYGIWGGTTEVERDRYRRENNIEVVAPASWLVDKSEEGTIISSMTIEPDDFGPIEPPPSDYTAQEERESQLLVDITFLSDEGFLAMLNDIEKEVT